MNTRPVVEVVVVVAAAVAADPESAPQAAERG